MANTLTKHTEGFTTIKNKVLKGTSLSPKAIGIWVQLLSLPQNWKFSKKGLLAIINIGERGLDAGLDELQKEWLFYLRKRKPTQKEPKMHYEYLTFDQPSKDEILKIMVEEALEFDIDVKEFLGVHYVGVENVGVQNVGLQNAGAYKESNNKPLNNKKLNDVKENSNKRKKFKKPTVEEIQVYCDERNSSINAEQFYDYYESKGWKVGNTPMKDWKACVRTWTRNNFNKPTQNNSKVFGKGQEQEYIDSIGEW